MKKYNMKLVFLLGLLIISVKLILSNDTKKEMTSVGKDNINTILPLNVGNRWIYRITYFDSVGAIKKIDTSIAEIKSDTIIKGEQWFTFGDNFWPHFLGLGKEGIYGLQYSLRSQIRYPVLYLKYPVAPGDSFDGNGMMGDSIFVVSTTENISVPKGSFRCIHYRVFETDISPPRLVYDQFWSENVGIVNHTIYDRTSLNQQYLAATSELIDYVLH